MHSLCQQTQASRPPPHTHTPPWGRHPFHRTPPTIGRCARTTCCLCWRSRSLTAYRSMFDYPCSCFFGTVVNITTSPPHPLTPCRCARTTCCLHWRSQSLTAYRRSCALRQQHPWCHGGWTSQSGTPLQGTHQQGNCYQHLKCQCPCRPCSAEVSVSSLVLLSSVLYMQSRTWSTAPFRHVCMYDNDCHLPHSLRANLHPILIVTCACCASPTQAPDGCYQAAC
jgi:hypothetical protein